MTKNPVPFIIDLNPLKKGVSGKVRLFLLFNESPDLPGPDPRVEYLEALDFDYYV